MADSPQESSSPPDDSADQTLLDELRVVVNRRTMLAGAAKPGERDRLDGTSVGRYRLQKLLGEGGMAQVYRALDEQLGRDVAIKVLKIQYRSDDGLCTRFEREARSMARIHHENVVHIFDFPRNERVSAIAMELLTGGSLRRRMDKLAAQEAKLPIDDAVRLARQATAGIAAAHELGIVHRDIKPSNLMLDAEDTVKVADFGTILVMEQTTWLTGVGQRVGTPAYMSPEQCRAERVSPASDIYSLGVTLFEMVTARLPFVVEEASPFAIMLKHISEPAADPRELRDDVPDWLARIILRCLNKAPADRYANAHELGKALRAREASSAAPKLSAAAGEGAINIAVVRGQLQHLPQRAIVFWACRCARRVQPLSPDSRAARAIEMAEASVTAMDEHESPRSLAGALSRISSLRMASLQAARADEARDTSTVSLEVSKAAAAAASSAAARCADDAAADAAFALRSAIAAIEMAGKPVEDFWKAAKKDYLKLLGAGLGEAGTIGRPIPPSLFAE